VLFALTQLIVSIAEDERSHDGSWERGASAVVPLLQIVHQTPFGHGASPRSTFGQQRPRTIGNIRAVSRLP
jgi:hypothetical protein